MRPVFWCMAQLKAQRPVTSTKLSERQRPLVQLSSRRASRRLLFGQDSNVADRVDVLVCKYERTTAQAPHLGQLRGQLFGKFSRLSVVGEVSAKSYAAHRRFLHGTLL
jgi:hypothetical protein